MTLSLTATPLAPLKAAPVPAADKAPLPALAPTGRVLALGRTALALGRPTPASSSMTHTSSSLLSLASWMVSKATRRSALGPPRPGPKRPGVSVPAAGVVVDCLGLVLELLVGTWGRCRGAFTAEALICTGQGRGGRGERLLNNAGGEGGGELFHAR